MSPPPNRPPATLTLAELERLSCLLEEMGEALQIIGKIQRFGFDSHHPNPSVRLLSNRHELEVELGQVRWAIEMMCNQGDLSGQEIDDAKKEKAVSAARWLRHQ